MNCHAHDRLYVRANGVVPCNCDTGESTILFRPDLDDLESFDYVEDCFNGAPFRELRRRLAADEAPIEACESCFFFHPGEPLAGAIVDGRVSSIGHIQIESSFLCGVDCDACVVRSTRTDPALSALGDGPYEMPVELFAKLVDDIRRAGLPVHELAFCGRGEPLLHPRFDELMDIVRSGLPDTFVSVVSSGNAPYTRGLHQVDYLSLSVDGGFPDSYEVYRKGGSLPRVLRFIETLVRERGRSENDKPRISWKYILFEHNDSVEEIEHAQRLAQDLGVDEFMFVLTHTWNRSTKYTTQAELATLPEFQVFDGLRRTFTNVNDETNNKNLWDRLGEKPKAERFGDGRD